MFERTSQTTVNYSVFFEKIWLKFGLIYVISCSNFPNILRGTDFLCFCIVNRDMVWKLGELQFKAFIMS